ncbi:hypothetical protein OEZ85_003434 [Tetradesmus obliquus]|uniref:Cation/H+ exchanger domain-containing protein n=1 Tax=Tetradesmus obliquus TaxID=3088 RepID=A0ABY8UBA3_TETOB|nr:hypothetical protein OEZ85_003434 [Tetradesmus obliquus]
MAGSKQDGTVDSSMNGGSTELRIRTGRRSSQAIPQPHPTTLMGHVRLKIDRWKPATASGISVSLEMLLLAAVVYGVLVFAIGKAFLPGSPAFATLVIWICSVVGAEIVHWLRIPRVVGMLGTGLLLANVPGGVVEAFPDKWGVQMRAAALATIFLRCGLELEFKTMSLYKWPALRLAFLPGVTEAIFDAGVATAVFHMPFPLALSLGFILKAVGPGLVVPAMFQLQKQGLGANKGIPSTVVIAASFDDIIAITGFSIFVNIAIATGENAAWQIASGPLQVLFGMGGGIIAGAVLGCTRIFNNKYKRLIGIYGAALLIMFFLEYFDMLSGGALGSLTVGLVTCYMWEHGKPGRLSQGPNNSHSADIERVAAVVWNWVMEPMLFATIGTSIVFAELPQGTIPKSLLVVCTGLVLRTIITYFIMGRRRYTWKEQLFYAVAWTPKATVQASLSAVPLSLINRTMVNDPNYEQWVQWGSDLLATGIFAIIICATLGTAMVFWLAPVLLEKSEDEAGLYRSSRSMSRALTKQQSLGTMMTQQQHPPGLGYGPEHLDPIAVLQDLRMADDHTKINEYFDAIEKLVTLVMEGHGQQAKDEGLCDAVMDLQEAISRDVGPRQLTVRQMLHSAALRSRQPAITAAAADQLVRLSLTGIGSVIERHGSGSDGTVQGVSPKAAAVAAAVLQGTSPRTGNNNNAPLGDVEQGMALESVGSTNIQASASAHAHPVVPAVAPRAVASSSQGAPGVGSGTGTSPRIESPFKAAAERQPSDS